MRVELIVGRCSRGRCHHSDIVRKKPPANASPGPDFAQASTRRCGCRYIGDAGVFADPIPHRYTGLVLGEVAMIFRSIVLAVRRPTLLVHAVLFSLDEAILRHCPSLEKTPDSPTSTSCSAGPSSYTSITCGQRPACLNAHTLTRSAIDVRPLLPFVAAGLGTDSCSVAYTGAAVCLAFSTRPGSTTTPQHSSDAVDIVRCRQVMRDVATLTLLVAQFLE